MSGMVVVVSLQDIRKVAKQNGYGEIECPWTLDDFEECGSYTVSKDEVTPPIDAWSEACLKIMEEENESILHIVADHVEEEAMTLQDAITIMQVHFADQSEHLNTAWDIVHERIMGKPNTDVNCIDCVDRGYNTPACGECRNRGYAWKKIYFKPKVDE